MLPLVRYMMAAMCANFQLFLEVDQNFTCILKSVKQIEREVFKGVNIKILTFDQMPLSGAQSNGKGELVGQGIAFELIDTLQEKFGFEYTVEKMPAIVGDENRGALAKLNSKEVDMVAAFMPVIPASNNYMQWGTDLGQSAYYVMLKRPADSNSGSGLLAPFDVVVWLLILVSLAVVGPVFYLVMWLRRRLCPLDEIDQVYPLSTCIWFVYGALMKQGSTLNPLADSARMVFAMWWMFILILTAFYTANLTAFLTLSISTLPIKEIDDVAKDGRHWFALEGGLIENSIKNKDDLTFKRLRESADRGQAYFISSKQESVILPRILSGYYYLDDAYSLVRMMYQDYKKKADLNIDEQQRCQFVLTEKTFMQRSLAFGYPKDSPLPSLFNPILGRFVESGILQHKLNLDLPDATICPKDLGNKERQLRIYDLKTTYFVVCLGVSLAFLIFLIEIGWRVYTKNRISKQGILNKHKILQSTLNADKLLAIRDQVQMKINGRDYYMVKKGTNQHLVPLRTPSALLFHYA
ncbi:Ligand-gated ion channel [Nesidiocoris tenuis]|uniref:Ligand-gated ion channel n=1 Tax=Nesidiocoris tenuis TaxID=355587 RepID=A0ABN7AGV9_9HEMI|nr:Ligand-gated ion channel [Nesidiocoris tenuis]